MIIVINPKKTLVITSLGLCLVGSLFAALKFYYRSTISKDKKTVSNKSRPRSSTKSSLYSTDSISKKNRKPLKSTETNFSHNENSENKPVPAKELLELGTNTHFQ